MKLRPIRPRSRAPPTPYTGEEAQKAAIAHAVWTEIHWMLPLHRIVSITVDGDDIAVELDLRTRSRLPRPLSAIRTEAPCRHFFTKRSSLFQRAQHPPRNFVNRVEVRQHLTMKINEPGLFLERVRGHWKKRN